MIVLLLEKNELIFQLWVDSGDLNRGLFISLFQPSTDLSLLLLLLAFEMQPSTQPNSPLCLSNG